MNLHRWVVRALIALSITVLGVVGMAATANAATVDADLEITSAQEQSLLPVQVDLDLTVCGISLLGQGTCPTTPPPPDASPSAIGALDPSIPVGVDADVLVCGIGVLGDASCGTAGTGTAPDGGAPTAIGGVPVAADADVLACGIGVLGDASCGDASTGGGTSPVAGGLIPVAADADALVCGVGVLGDASCGDASTGGGTGPSAIGGVAVVPDVDALVCGVGVLGDGSCEAGDPGLVEAVVDVVGGDDGLLGDTSVLGEVLAVDPAVSAGVCGVGVLGSAGCPSAITDPTDPSDPGTNPGTDPSSDGRGGAEVSDAGLSADGAQVQAAGAIQVAGTLPYTGGDPWGLAGLGGALLALGIALMAIRSLMGARRRIPTHPDHLAVAAVGSSCGFAPRVVPCTTTRRGPSTSPSGRPMGAGQSAGLTRLAR